MGWRWSLGVSTVWRTTVFMLHVVSTALAKRHVVFWNSTNARLAQGGLSIQVNLSDYLDIYCPHYPAGMPTSTPPETLALYLVAEGQFRGCVETRGAIKRWECNSPHAPFGPVRFSEKIQRFTPFSLGFEFLPGHHYYYSSLPTEEGPPLTCLKLRVTVCCESTTTESNLEQGTPAPRSAASSVMSTALPLIFIIPLFLLSSI
ncbi:ephrin-A4 [Megalops cyprinoides]|uniref:ephrin-A4 n=1 Tax=Megalops cyprinoides TaxID=118141 RepID=UPI0018650161|nr:ephrin-A4 [Megalops cyprinoides]